MSTATTGRHRIAFPPGRRRAHRGTVSSEPPFDVVDSDGRRTTIRPSGPGDTVGDLVRAVGGRDDADVHIDGVHVERHVRLRTSGVRHGSQVELVTSPYGSSPAVVPMGDDVENSTGVIEVAVVAGPACTPWTPLPAGRHQVGRARTAGVRIDDPAVEPHLGVVTVDGCGSATFVQLTGRIPARVGGRPAHGSAVLAAGDTLTAGASQIRHRRSTGAATATSGTGAVVDDPASPWRRTLHRGAATEVVGGELAAPEVPVPPPERRPPSATALVGAGVAVIGGAVMASLLGHLLMALFGVIGALASVGTWAAGWIGCRRTRRADRAAYAQAVDDFGVAMQELHRHRRRAHVRRHLPVSDVLAELEQLHAGRATTIWSRRLGTTDPFVATLGAGADRWHAPLDVDDRRRLTPDLDRLVDDAERLDDVAVPLALDPGSVVALHGDPALVAALCRSIVIQLAAHHGPADWNLVVVTDRPADWQWVTWLPHGAEGRAHVVGAGSKPDGQSNPEPLADCRSGTRTLLVTDTPAALVTRTSPVRRLLATTDTTCVAVIDADEPVPAVCGRVVEVGSTGCIGSTIAAAGITVGAAACAARRLASLVDPEAVSSSDRLDVDLRIGDLLDDLARDPATIARQWATAGDDPPPAAVVGASVDGLMELDLVRDGPHGLVAGTTGSGKSELLRTLVLALAARVSPAHLTFVLVDYKGGATFDACARLPHTVGCVTDLDDGLAERALVSLDAEVLRREHLLRDAGADDLGSYRRSRPDEPLPRLVVVIDEFATLARELPGFLTSLVAIAQRGRSLGVHLLLATQRPAGVVTDDIRANTNLRVALRLTDAADATDVVGDPAPARISRARPGRAVLRLGPDELVEFQAASCSGELETWVDAVCAAARSAGLAAPRRPWIEPLPHPLPGSMSTRDGVGLVDDPARQCHHPLRWSPASGNLRLVGSVGSGTTTALLAVAVDLCRSADPGRLHLYVIDGRGDDRLDGLATVEHCGAVIRLTETERIDRLLRRLTDEIDRRTSTGERSPAVVVMVDGLDAVRASLSTVERAASAERLARLVANGPDAGVTVCFTVDGGSPAALTTPAADSWLFHSADPAVTRALGVAGVAVPSGLPGRLVVASSGLTAQIADAAGDVERLGDMTCLRALAGENRAGVNRGDGAVAGGPAPVEMLSPTIDPDLITIPPDDHPPDDHPPDGFVRLPIGVGADDLRVDALELATGDHVVIVGASRTGTSTALRQVVFAWRRLIPDGRIVTVSTRTRLAADQLPPPPVLIVVDDADRVDDHSGTLAAIAAGRHPGVTIAAAGRLEAMRSAYGHWTRDAARSRCGIVMTATGDVDGDLLGTTLPRRTSIPARPGLGWLVDRRGHRLVQVAARLPA